MPFPQQKSLVLSRPKLPQPFLHAFADGLADMLSDEMSKLSMLATVWLCAVSAGMRDDDAIGPRAGRVDARNDTWDARVANGSDSWIRTSRASASASSPRSAARRAA